MAIASADIVPFTTARANLSDLAEEVKAGAEKLITKNGESYVALIDASRLDYYHQLERERIHLVLLDDARQALADIESGRTQDAATAIAQLQQRRRKSRGVVGEAPARVRVTEFFLARLETIEAFLESADAAAAFDTLLDGLYRTVIPNLTQFPRMGRRFVDLVPRSVEAISQWRLLALPSESLRDYLHSDYLILYASVDTTVYLLSIRHHKELAYDFVGVWPN